ncbi:MAG: hypothetical protein HOL28_08990 [Crocinitomicaceae bacterium]|jgi:hypothetical protein|nr:hypothetical protein [Crocinitomicaceae bacterium]MDG2331037.1 paraquat-inducible protein A [Flavobacteriales bacterium]
MKARNLVYLFILFAFVLTSAYGSYKMLGSAKEFLLNREKYTEAVVLTEGILDPVSWIPNGSWEEKVARADVFKARSNRAHDSILKYGLWMSLIAFLLIVAPVILFLRNRVVWRYLAYSTLSIAVFALIIGVATPMMEMAAFNTDLTIPFNFSQAASDFPMLSSGMLELISFDVTFEGRMYYFYQSKSIMGLIQILLSQGNYFVGIAILIFSLILPVTKLFCSFLQLFSTRFANNRIVFFITNYLGKWSMADVFVVALFLGYFSFANMNVGIETQTKPLFGLYCFASYVILSLLSTHFINLCLKSESNNDK